MRLATIASIRAAMGLDDLSEINAVIAFALDTATLTLQAKLQTQFDRETRQDVFQVGTGTWLGGLPQTSLKLERGFLDSGATVFYAATRANLSNDIKRQITTGFDITLEQGLVGIFDIDLTGQWVSVDYTAGFNVDASDPNLFDLTEVPSFLQVSTQIEVMASLQTHPLFAEAATVGEAQALHDQLDKILSLKADPIPHALTALA